MNRTYVHGRYAHFVVRDSKRRDIAVAPVRDRVVHRLVYDYLMPRWDQTFIHDAWSCRPRKGQQQALERAASFMRRYEKGWVWRADIRKFFDNVDQATLSHLIRRRTTCPAALWLMDEILGSYYKEQPGRGMPIGNLTSQIFANIYLNEFDRYMVHNLKPQAYLRYGDDWLCFATGRDELMKMRRLATTFLHGSLYLDISPKLNLVMPVQRGATYLGVDIWPTGKRMTRATQQRVQRNLQPANFASYQSLVSQLMPDRALKNFYWQTLDINNSER